MQIETCRPRDLSQRELDAWREAIADAVPFGSPFFHPEYVLALAEFRPQVEVAVVRQHGDAVGWLPFERHGSVGQPLGIKLADFQGAIFREGYEVPLDQMISKTGLKVWKYDHLLAEQAPQNGRLETDESPWLDLRDGYDAYVARRRAAGSATISKTMRKHQKLIEGGHSVEFCWHDPAPEALKQLWEWKSAQRLATGTMDVLQIDWVCPFLERIAQTEQSGFRGIVSTLRIDGELAAVHMGMHTATTFHHWFPAYSSAWGPSSPGLIILLFIAREAAQRGMQRIDLGKGEDRYKSSFASGITHVSTGTIDDSFVRQALRTSLSSTKQWVKNSPLRAAAKWPARWWRRWRTQTSMETTSP